MLRGASFLISVAVASLAAVPLALLSYVLVAVSHGWDVDLRLHGQTWLHFPLFAALPIAFGTAGMAALGHVSAWARTSLAWGVAGAVVSGATALLIGFWMDLPLAIMLILTGTGCALVSRPFVRWTTPAP